jgi:hypothetical protein
MSHAPKRAFERLFQVREDDSPSSPLEEFKSTCGMSMYVSSAAYWQDAAEHLNAKLIKNFEALKNYKRELEAVNNEFGSQTAEWPGAWQRIAMLKQQLGRQYVQLLKYRSETIRMELVDNKPTQEVLKTIMKLVGEDMTRCTENGANSLSMPDELVSVAVWIHEQEKRNAILTE